MVQYLCASATISGHEFLHAPLPDGVQLRITLRIT